MESLIDQKFSKRKNAFGTNHHFDGVLLEKEENVKLVYHFPKSDDSCFLDKKTEEQNSAVSELIKQEVNVKELQLINAEEASHLIVNKLSRISNL